MNAMTDWLPPGTNNFYRDSRGMVRSIAVALAFQYDCQILDLNRKGYYS